MQESVTTESFGGGDIEVVAVENNPEIAVIYQDHFDLFRFAYKKNFLIMSQEDYNILAIKKWIKRGIKIVNARENPKILSMWTRKINEEEEQEIWSLYNWLVDGTNLGTNLKRKEEGRLHHTDKSVCTRPTIL